MGISSPPWSPSCSPHRSTSIEQRPPEFQRRFTTLLETPMWHDEFRDKLPHQVVDLVNNYRLRVTHAEAHVRRALTSIGRFPATTFLNNPSIDPNTLPAEPPLHPILPPRRGLAPGQYPPTTNNILYRLPTHAIPMQHTATQTSFFPPLTVHSD